jgi:uncharacterized protein (TIGR00730 family)
MRDSESNQPPRLSIKDPAISGPVDALITQAGGDPNDSDSRFIREMILASLKLLQDGRDRGELKLMASTMKELRHAFRVFARYPLVRKISIFGSARTPEDHPDYKSAVEFSSLMARRDWAVITGAGDGIMKAGHVGPGRESSFGLAIRLPFETTANTVIAGDSKLITFRYFFTRKLMFVSQANAVAVFPGGFGTMDETFEVLTLIQTGKSSMIPVVLLEGKDGTYWQRWKELVKGALLDGEFVSDDDLNLLYIASSPADAADHVQRFYRNFHSSRYVRDDFVIRLRQRVRDEAVSRLNDEFSELVREGKIVQRDALPEEEDHLELPRIVFTHTRWHYGMVRKLIDRINELEPDAELL